MRSKTLHLTNPLMKGERVREAQELLKKHGYFHGGVDGVFGPATAKACKRAKYDLGYLRRDIKPSYGDPLDGLLAGTIKLPAGYRVRRLARRRATKRKVNAETTQRAQIVANAKWLIEHKGSCTYAQIRPIDGEHQRHKLPLRFDCSGAATDCYAWADNVSDPNGERYNGLGFTGTLYQHMHHITAEEVKPGDIGIYGNYPGHHAVLALEHGPDPVVFSMGHQGDPNSYRASVLASSLGSVHWFCEPGWAH